MVHDFYHISIGLGIQTLKIGFLNLFISVVSGVLGETTHNSYLTAEPVSMESDMLGVVSLSLTEISKIPRLQIRS